MTKNFKTMSLTDIMKMYPLYTSRMINSRMSILHNLKLIYSSVNHVGETAQIFWPRCGAAFSVVIRSQNNQLESHRQLGENVWDVL